MTESLDFIKLGWYILKRIWLPILFALVGFLAMAWYAINMIPDTYTTSATLYVYNANPSLINYQYADSGSIAAANKLIETYAVVVRSNKVLDAVAERLGTNVSAGAIASTLTLSSVGDTGVMRVSCTTRDPQLSMDICNAVVDVAPAEIIRVVSAGSVQVIDYAYLPTQPNDHQVMRRGITGAMGGAVAAVALLVLLFLLNRRLTDSKELTDNYKLPLLASIPRQHKHDERTDYVIGPESASQLLASYAKLRMNVVFACENKTIRTLLISSAVPGEGKSTIAANLAVSFSMDGERVLLVDCDMRKPKQSSTFRLEPDRPGLSDMLAGLAGRDDVIVREVREGLDILPSGTIPPNASELLHSPTMINFLRDMQDEYDRILLDMPPINVLIDSLTLTEIDAGMLFITRCDYSDHREIRKALSSAEFAKINVLGIIMNCASRTSDGYYNYRYYGKYYGYYDNNHPHRHARSGNDGADGEQAAGPDESETKDVGRHRRSGR